MSIWQHKTRGTKYRIVCLGKLEHNLDQMVVYQDINDNEVWIRPVNEFFDGRFIELKEEK